MHFAVRLFKHICDLFFFSQCVIKELAREENRPIREIRRNFWYASRMTHIYSDRYAEIRRSAASVAVRDEKIEAFVEQTLYCRKWGKRYWENWQFLAKYSSMAYDVSAVRIAERISQYKKRYNMGERCWVQYGVTIISEHYSDGMIKIGDDVLLARDVDLDFTGGLEIGDDVKIMEGVKILTHAHDVLKLKADSKMIPHSNRAYKTPLRIGNNVQIASRAQILPGVHEIGENSMISAGSVVTKKVPPRVVVAGNPAKIVAEIPDDSILKVEVV